MSASRRCLLIGALLLSACAVHRPAGDDGGREEEVLDVLRLQAEAWNRGDVEGFMAGYHRSESTSFASDQGVLLGWDALLERYRMRYPDRAAMGQLSFGDLHVETLGGETALVRGAWRLERRSDAPGGVFSVVMRRFPDGWKIIHDHTSAFAEDPQ